MGKNINKILIGALAGLCIGSVSNISNNFSYEKIKQTESIEYTMQENNGKIFSRRILAEPRDLGQEVVIEDSNLRDAICNLLGKETTEKIYSKDFLEHPDYKPTTPEGGSTPEAKLNCINLSQTGVKNITPLFQFELPETLQSIDLSGNEITNEDLVNITTLLSLNKTSQPILIEETPYNIQTDFDTTIKCINLNDNKLNLNYLDTPTLENSKFIFGFQFLPKEKTTKPSETKTHYYIKSNDNIYLSFHLWIDNIEFNLNENSVSNILKPFTEDIYHGKYKISISSVPNSESAYFRNYSKICEFFAYDIKFEDGDYLKDGAYIIERNKPFLININKIAIKGFVPNKITYEDQPTNKCGTYSFNIKVETSLGNFELPLNYIVIDTRTPELVLQGESIMYCRKNRPFEDPGCIAMDYYKEDITGDIVTSVTSDNGETFVNVTKLGTYIITYKVSDSSGNTASITRKVIVQELVLDKIVVRYNTEELQVGKDIIITAEPENGIPVSNYKDYSYKWYLDGVHFQTTKGDLQTGKSQVCLNFDSIGEKKVTVKLTAKQTADDKEITVSADDIILTIEPAFKSDNTVILAAAVAVVIVIISIMSVTIIKAKKGKNKIHKKAKSKSKEKEEPKPESNIQVIKDYDPNNPNNPDTNKLFNSDNNDKN